MRVTFRQIDAFRAVMVTGTVTQAAEMLHVSQPAVSRMLSDLEYELGFKLFERASRHVRPTDEAKALYREVQRAFLGLNEILGAAAAIKEYKLGHLRLLAIPSVSSSIVPPLLARFATRFPHISVALEVEPPLHVLDSIVTQRYDLGITVLPVDTKLVAVTRLLRCECVCILPKGHRLESRNILHPKDLAGEKFVSFGADSLFRFQVDEIFRTASVERVLRTEARTTEAVVGMVAAGLGVSIIAPYFQDHVPISDIVVRPFQPTVALDLAIVEPRHKSISRVAEQFKATALEYAAELRKRTTMGVMKQAAARRTRS